MRNNLMEYGLLECIMDYGNNNFESEGKSGAHTVLVNERKNY